MCGASIEVDDNKTIAICDYCGSSQTIPTLDGGKKENLYKRGYSLRAAGEYDRASIIFENIVSEFPKEAEAYWGIVLCKYGIEYVEDPKTGNRVPTCHRTITESIFDDPDYKNAIKNADVLAKDQYSKEASQIDNLQKKILEISSHEMPYDIFICYKETDSNGERTQDSILAYDIYKALTAEKYKVFYSKISLDGKLGSKYEPYIYSALNSAHVMVHVTTSIENTDAVWVKNEWSRYLKTLKPGRYFIPCYKGILPSELPDEMKNFQGQDMSKVGSIQNLVIGINSIFKSIKRDNEDEQSSGGYWTLINNGNSALKAGLFDSALDFFEKSLSESKQPGDAYFGILLAKHKASNISDLISKYWTHLLDDEDYKLAVTFSGNNSSLKSTLDAIKKNCLEKSEKYQFDDFREELNKNLNASECKQLIDYFELHQNYKDGKNLLLLAIQKFILAASTLSELNLALEYSKVFDADTSSKVSELTELKIEAIEKESLLDNRILVRIPKDTSIYSLVTLLNSLKEADIKEHDTLVTSQKEIKYIDENRREVNVLIKEKLGLFVSGCKDLSALWQVRHLMDDADLNKYFEDFDNVVRVVDGKIKELTELKNAEIKRKKNRKKIIIGCILAVIAIIIISIVGSTLHSNYVHSPERISTKIVSKSQEYNPDVSPYLNGCYYIYLDYEITCNSEAGVDYLEIITDVSVNGEEIGSIKSSLESMNLSNGETKTFSTYLQDNQPEENENYFFIDLYNANFLSLSFEYEIQSILFSDGHYWRSDNYQY